MSAAAVAPVKSQLAASGGSSKPVTSKMMWFKAPPAVYFGWAGTGECLADLDEARCRRAFIVCDRNVYENNHVKVVTDKLDMLEIDYEVYADVSRPTAAVVSKVVAAMKIYGPDSLIAMGGGSVMDVAKVCRIIYDPNNTHKSLSDLYAYDHMQLLSDREETTGVSRLPPCDMHIKKLVCIPTTSASGSEMTPVAWVFEEDKVDSSALALKRPIISWRMTPDIAISDAFFTLSLSKSHIISGGLSAFTIAVESAVSRLANDYTRSISIRSANLLLKHLTTSVKEGDQGSRTHCHNAASLAGMAAANAFVGLAHALSFVLQRFFEKQGTPKAPGVTSCLVLSQVIKFNAGRCSKTAKLYGRVAEQCGLASVSDATEDDMTKSLKLVAAFEQLKGDLCVEKSIKDCGVTKAKFDQVVDALAEETLTVVGCTATNPVEVLLDDAKHVLIEAFDGCAL